MKKVLHINSHPLFESETSSTVQLSQHGLALLQGIPGIETETLNLYSPDTFIPRVDEQMFSMWSKQSADMSHEERLISEAQNKIIDQWIAADYIFIYSPLHNFNVTAKFKDYIDNLLIAGRTFRYTKTGSVGLLDADKKVVYVQSSGSDYRSDIVYVNADIAPHYVRTILSFMGIKHMHFISAQGLNMSSVNRAEEIENAKKEITKFIRTQIGWLNGQVVTDVHGKLIAH